LSSEKIDKYGYFDSKRVGLLVKKIKAGRSIGYGDNMALVSILSTQVWHYLFVDNFEKQLVMRERPGSIIKVN